MRFEIREFDGGSDGPFWWVVDTHWKEDGEYAQAVTICFAIEETAQHVCDILNEEWKDMTAAIA